MFMRRVDPRPRSVVLVVIDVGSRVGSGSGCGTRVMERPRLTQHRTRRRDRWHTSERDEQPEARESCHPGGHHRSIPI
jgi:hypothetical protein